MPSVAKSSKPSAAELLARMSGRKKMEPTKADAVQDIESARLELERIKAMDPRPSQAVVNNAAGVLMTFEDTYKSVVGDRYNKRPAMRQKDEKALRELFEATHGFRWADAHGWIGRKGYPGRLGIEHFATHASHWHGVRAEIDPKANQVVAVEVALPDNELEGTVPASLRDLKFLKRLDLSGNLLEGTLPTGLLHGLTDLQFLKICDNRLEGFLAPALEPHKHLLSIDAHANLFEGPVPKGLADLKKVQSIDLGSNQLEGPLPPEIGEKLGACLQCLILPQNALSGELPPSFSNLTHLRELDLSSNGFGGDVPLWLEDLTHLEVLDLSRNKFTGALPLQLGQLKRLSRLLVQVNAIGGAVPESLGQCRRLELLNLSYNALEGYVPESIADLTNLQVLLLHDNPLLLCPLPERLGNLTKLLDMCIVDPAPSNDLAGSRRFNREHFEITRIQGREAGLNNWTAPG